jgi:putative acetyltransferase
MTLQVTIRDESALDHAAIDEVTVAAFQTLAISGNTEHFIIRALRAAGVLRLSLVAQLGGRVVGHIAFSPVTISDSTLGWYGLGPVSVSPEYHRQGIGSGLIREGLSRLRKMGARGCCLVGDPNYYHRFGFHQVPGLVHKDVPEEAFLALPLDGVEPQGTVEFHEGFWATANPGDGE